MIYKAVVWDVMQLMFQKFNDHQLHSVIYFDSQLDEDCIKKSVDMSLDAFPIIRCKFVEKSCFKFPYWEDYNFKSDDMVNLVKTEDIEGAIKKLIVFNINETLGPQMRFNIIRSSKRDVLCIVFNHMIADAAGFREYLYMLSSIYSNLKKNPGYVCNYSMGSRSVKQVFKRFSFSDKLKILKASSHLSKYNTGAFFPLEGDMNHPFIERYKISREKFFRIKAYAKNNDATINDVLLAAYMRSLSKVLGVKHISLPCPVDLRKYLPGRKADGIANFISNMICDIGEDMGDTFNDTLLKVKKCMDNEKKSFSCLNGPLMLEIVFGILPYKMAKGIVNRAFTNPLLAMTNIGIIDKNKLQFEGLNVKDTFICGSIKYKPYFQVAVTTFDNEVTLSVNFYGTENDRKKIREFLCVLGNELPY